MALDELDDIVTLTARIKTFDKRIKALARRQEPQLLTLPGCGELSAAKLLGESAGVTRFKSEAAFARHAGMAPIPVWSGRTDGKVRMTRSGNRQINCALHRVAITQIRLSDSLGRAYYDKKPSRRHDQPGSTEMPQATVSPHRLQPPQRRPRLPIV